MLRLKQLSKCLQCVSNTVSFISKIFSSVLVVGYEGINRGVFPEMLNIMYCTPQPTSLNTEAWSLLETRSIDCFWPHASIWNIFSWIFDQIVNFTFFGMYGIHSEFVEGLSSVWLCGQTLSCWLPAERSSTVVWRSITPGNPRTRSVTMTEVIRGLPNLSLITVSRNHPLLYFKAWPPSISM